MKLIKPMLLSTGTPFDSPDWIFELKFDGFRVIAYIEQNGRTQILSRQGRNLNSEYPEFASIKTTAPCILDGEIVALTDGRPDFNKLLRRERNANHQFIVFDILSLNNSDITNLPLMERKKVLAETVEETNSTVLSRYISTYGVNLFHQVCLKNLEGIVAKHKNSVYLPGKRSRDWLKIKCYSHTEYIKKGRGHTRKIKH